MEAVSECLRVATDVSLSAQRSLHVGEGDGAEGDGAENAGRARLITLTGRYGIALRDPLRDPAAYRPLKASPRSAAVA
jgi:hypothetical protein